MRTILLGLAIMLLISCKTTTKDTGPAADVVMKQDDCYPHRKVVYEYREEMGEITSIGEFYIILHTKTKSRLQPCSLPQQFRQDSLLVNFSGDQVEINPGERRFAKPLRLHQIALQTP